MDYTRSEVLQYVAENDVKFIRLAFCDICGTMKNLAILADELPRAFETGISFDASSLDGFMNEDQDLLLFPDPGTLKAVSYTHLDVYKRQAHGRYPTNTPGWWGGAHPFAMLEYSIVHNGEISSYDANRRAIEMFGYKCTLLTDTEVITYTVSYTHLDVYKRQVLPCDPVAVDAAAEKGRPVNGRVRYRAGT